MNKRRKPKAPPSPAANPPGRAASAIPPAVAGWKLWAFRLLAAVGAPAICLALLELILRLAGFGYPTAFLLPSSHDGRKTFIENNRFGWRFFGPQMARLPDPFSIPQIKPPGTVRIFVFGGSAAFGDPQPQFGLPRMLQALLSLRHPGVHFEVVNAAMTAINSNVVLPIARDCAGAGGDLWVIYLGNNEVVGPFGAGTVFGSEAPPLPLISATLALKTTRVGQALDALRRRIEKPPLDKSEWGGMEMFLHRQVRADDPRMAAVYDHFARNLEDILRAGERRGVGIVLSTVAVNLKDCAPFGSEFQPGLSAPDQARWKEWYQQGVAAEQAGQNQTAETFFKEAGQIDGTVADLRFRQGDCALALDRIPEAQRDFRAARDLDTLRFRCDSRLNELIRQAATSQRDRRVLLADAALVFAEQSPDGLPGGNFFYEHVHLNFDGNYLLAKTIAAQLEKLLPASIKSRPAAARPWPSEADCARRLAWSDWDQARALADIFTRLTDPPFTGQLNHDAQVRQVKTLMEKLAPATRPAGLRRALTDCEQAVAAAPGDPALYAQLAALQQAAGDLAAASAAAQRQVALLPSSSVGWAQLGFLLAQQQHYEQAIPALRRAFELDPQNVWALQNLAESLLKLDRRAAAIREFRRALAVNPRFGLAWLGLGQALEAAGETNQAEQCYRQALANPIHRAAELTELARFCQSRGWFEAAATNYESAIRLSPLDPALRIAAGQCLAALGRQPDAVGQFGTAVQLEPDSEAARFLYGLALGRAGQTAEAVEQFRAAVRIMPDLVEARLNLAIALTKIGRDPEALAQFKEALQRSPTNAVALEYVRALRAKLGAEKAR
ncbi:MAG: tetratricopeptide repeat protein [Verrucomicrobiota bacterium]|nr:tetratricopeptide repeat protein [Verrucomicrobiota bacterium]